MGRAEGVNGLSLLIGYDGEKRPCLIGGKCRSCGAVCFPRQSICSRCTGQDIEGILLSRKGVLFTYTKVHQKPPDYKGPVPYYIGRVLLPEGVFVLAQLKRSKEELKIDMDMELVVEPIYRDASGEERWGYKFKPV